MPNQDNFPVIFDRLKVLFREFVPPLVVTADTPDKYSLSVPYSPKYPIIQWVRFIFLHQGER